MVLTVLEIDTTTPHSGVLIEGGCATREASGGGWVTVRSSVPLSARKPPRSKGAEGTEGGGSREQRRLRRKQLKSLATEKCTHEGEGTSLSSSFSASSSDSLSSSDGDDDDEGGKGSSSPPLLHHWACRVIDQGEGNDGSGLMIGLLPKLAPSGIANMSSRYVSELGGWCVSRAGESYGSWRCDVVPFKTGQVIEFCLDFEEKTLYVTCGKEKAVGIIPTLGDHDEVYPAFSLYYLNQKVAFV